jgi:hypothetical protein
MSLGFLGQRRVVRATLVGGGFVVAPQTQGAAHAVRPDSLLMQMMEMVPGGWLPPRSPFAYALFYQMLSAAGGIREVSFAG